MENENKCSREAIDVESKRLCMELKKMLSAERIVGSSVVDFLYFLNKKYDFFYLNKIFFI